MTAQSWFRELGEEAQSAWAQIRAFWIEDVWPLFMTAGIFLLMAAPIIVVILILWYLDAIGWRSGSGFYTIGSLARDALTSFLG